MSKRNSFFDPYNKQHVKSYCYFIKHGCWPKDFGPKDGNPLHFASLQSDAAGKMAIAWAKQLIFGIGQDIY